MIREGLGRRGHLLWAQTREDAVEADDAVQAVEQVRPALEQERREDHGEHRDGEEALVQASGEQARGPALPGEDERELPDLRHREPRQQGHARRVAQERRADGGGEGLAGQEHGHAGEGEPGVREDDVQLDQHPDGHEEQRDEDVAEG